MMSRKFFKRVLVSSLIGVLAVASATAQGTRRSIKTRTPVLASDKQGYSPGTQAILSGSGFLSNERVRLQVLHAEGESSHEPWTVTANDRGRFVTSWLCADDCVGQLLVVRAEGESSGTGAGTQFTNSHDCGTGVVVSVTPVGGSCSAFTPAQGNGPDNYEVQEGGTYTMTIAGVTECTGDTITVFVQSSSTGNFCFNAFGGSGTYVGTLVMPNPACNTMPVSYKCGADASCTHPGSFAASGPNSGCGGVHLRASNFNGSCVKTGTDTDCDAPTPEGACCLMDGSCVQATEANCLGQGGTYSGDSTLCVDVTCPAPTGACCLVDGSCVQVTEEDCTAQSGAFHGDFSMCGNVVCPQPAGACCLVDGTCIEVTEEDCQTAGGTFHGDFSLCADVTCPQPAGACCLADGSCVQVTEADCLAAGGTYNGDFSLCKDSNCPQPPGACCLADGSCVEVTEEDCTALGGMFNGDSSLCVNVSCMQPIVCYVLDFETDDDGNPMPHGAMVDGEFDCNGAVFSIAITGSANPTLSNTAAILNSTTGPATQDPDLLVGRGNILILQTDGNQTQCPPLSGVYCTHNDDPNGGELTFDFCVPAIPSSIVLVDIDGSDPLSTVVLTDVNGKTRTYAVPGNWTGDKVANSPEPGWKVLDLTTLANQPGFLTTATASEQAGYDPNAVIRIDVNLGGSGAVDDLSWCQ